MPAPAIPAGYLVADLCILTQNGILRTRTYWSSDTPPDNETHLTVAADAIKSSFTPHLPNLLPDQNFFQRVECKWYGSGNTFFFANSVAAAGIGLIEVPTSKAADYAGSEGSEDVMPNDTAVIIQKKTGLRGRANQGRVFIGGIAEEVNWAGEVATDKEGAVKALAARFNTDITVNGSGFSTVLHGRHWNRKENSMKPITKVYVVKAIGSRMDRRPKTLYERI